MRRIKPLIISIVSSIILPALVNYFTTKYSFDDMWNNKVYIFLYLSVLINIFFFVYSIIDYRNPNDIRILSRIKKNISEFELEYLLDNIFSKIPLNYSDVQYIYDIVKYSKSESINLKSKKAKRRLNNLMVSLNDFYEFINKNDDYLRSKFAKLGNDEKNRIKCNDDVCKKLVSIISILKKEIYKYNKFII